MRIQWLYLDKKLATLKALQDFHYMERIIESYEPAIEEAQTRMLTCRTPALTLAKGSSAGCLATAEDRIADTIDEIDLVQERYRRAVEYMDWFHPAWDALDESERLVLHEFYQSGTASRHVVLNAISRELYVERAQIYRIKDKALEHLALLLFGK